MSVCSHNFCIQSSQKANKVVNLRLPSC